MKISNFMARQFSNPSGVFGRYITGPLLNRSNSKSNALIFSMMEIGTNDTVLELGFGGGELLFTIAEHSRCQTIFGVERSEEMVFRAMRKAARMNHSKSIHLFTGASEALPFDDETFDHVCGVNTVYFWKDLPKNLMESNRVLRANGEIFLGFGDAVVLKKQGYADKGFALYSPNQVRTSLIQCGFETIEERTISRLKRGKFYAFRYRKLGATKCEVNEQ